MGSLSRTVDGWISRATIMNAWQHGGSGGRMATLMHEELENISHATSQMTSSIEHLAWVQEQAARVQLTALYRISQLQTQTLEEIGKVNDTLVQVSSQLTEVADILRDLKGTQDEHLRIVKAERTLKEVLFQLTTMFEEMILPEDDVARLFLCQVALDEFDHHGLGTAHLSDLADKRAFADFVKGTRKTVRDTPEEVQAELTGFETLFKTYQDGRGFVFPPFESLDGPEWIPHEGPQWRPEREPVWYETPEPQLVLRPLPPKPETKTHPGDHPLPEHFGKMPDTLLVAGALINYPYQRVAPGTFTPDTVPSLSETRERLPPPAKKGFMQYLDSVINSTEWKNANRFEGALRTWAQQCKDYDTYVSDLAAWEKECEAITAENAVFQNEIHPKALQEWQEKEDARRADFERECEEHVKSEKRRRKEWETACRQHEESEAARRAEWEEAQQEHETNEAKRRKEWKEQYDTFLREFKTLGNCINEFLEEHPDFQLVYTKVKVEEDIAQLKKQAAAAERKRAEAAKDIKEIKAAEARAAEMAREAAAAAWAAEIQ